MSVLSASAVIYKPLAQYLVLAVKIVVGSAVIQSCNGSSQMNVLLEKLLKALPSLESKLAATNDSVVQLTAAVDRLTLQVSMTGMVIAVILGLILVTMWFKKK